MFGEAPYNVQKVERTMPDDRGGPPQTWWPLWAGVARSGDLGFTTGPFTYAGKVMGYYFTVWKRQSEGSWKWLHFGGHAYLPAIVAPKNSPPAYLPVSTSPGRDPKAAYAEVKAAEAALAAGAKVDARAAYLRVMAADGRLVGSGAAPLNTLQGQAAELAIRPAKITFWPLGGEASGAGDFAWTYGGARWVVPPDDSYGMPRPTGRGYYVRIWQRRGAGWRLVYDAISAVPPPSPPQ